MTARPMTEGLEPCPFCGGAVKVAHHKGSDETGERWDYFSVECRGKDHNVICDSGDTAEEVAASWNRRSTSAAVRGMREALEWRSIATAPKDGSEFIAFQDGDIYRCAWRVIEPDEAPGYEGWWDFSNSSFEEPTNWLPMPALSGIEPGEDEQARGQGRSAPISTDTKGTTK